MDVIYPWVDGAWPGFDELLRSYATSRHDLNPNRYRDNLSLLKYSLRSLARFLPWVERVWIVTCRPQVPPWLDPSAVRLVHHDEFMPAGDLPTFNSFAIAANLHRIPGLARRFLYLNDDLLFGAPVIPDDVVDRGGRALVYEKLGHTPAARRRDDPSLSPWNLALACSNALLDEKFGARSRRYVSHVPTAVELESWHEMLASWPEVFARTSASRFRAAGNVPPAYLYSHFLLDTGRAVRVPFATVYRQAAYHPVRNVPFIERIGLARIRRQQPKFFCLNDGFGARPNPRVVGTVTRFLDDWFPEPSRFEKDAGP